MSLLLLSNPVTSLSPFLSSSSSFPAIQVPRLQFKPIDLGPKSLKRVGFENPNLCSCKRDAIIVKAASSLDIDGTAPKESKEIEELPLESKLKEREEQKLKMKMAKKIRLRRKRLVRKRILRKKGRWPPSKMKKLKNV
ncbi:hypothetical protein JCGZ_00263 [Jatropha curcas]|uniref:Uncharacterized protein n=1 Tax=Jatropha curcas TaxID=180498 RepID=A0A067L1W4_JATCU|nr:50S ribosomal protein 5, chloroplastic [Jatropha curcas]KDP42466.1 hypothetical protein JCGZ_00263 [Jatropha curcas]